MLAAIGGFLGRKGDKEPGTTALWAGHPGPQIHKGYLIAGPSPERQPLMLTHKALGVSKSQIATTVLCKPHLIYHQAFHALLENLPFLV